MQGFASSPVADAQDAGTAKYRPCDACRRRKIRCVIPSDAAGGAGAGAAGAACALCRSRSDECTFVHSAPRKKRRVETGTGAQQDRQQDGSDVNNTPSCTSYPVDDYASLPGPSLLRRTLGHQNRQSISYVGLTSEHDPQLLAHRPFGQNGEHRGPDLTFRHVGQYLASDAANFIIRDDTASEVEQELRALDAIEAVVSPHGPALVELYFRIVHPSFPILHKKVFLEKHGRTYRESTPIGLAAVYMLALDWWSYSPELSKLPKPDTAQLDRLVRRCQLEAMDRPKISDLQGSLILLQRPDHSHDHGSWARTGQLVSMAHELGLHDDCSSWNLPPWEPGVRKRVAWALYAQDKWGALVYGRPSHLDARNWDVQPLDVGDFPETSLDDDDEEGSVEVEKGRLIFVHFIALTQILADVLDAFFTLRAAKAVVGNSTAEVVDRARGLQERLAQWYAGLPARLSMDDTKSRKLSSTGYLHLAYHAVDITLHRAFLRDDHALLAPQLRHSIRTSATRRLLSAIDFVKQLKPVHLQSFWYAASKHNLALIGTLGGLLWSTSTSETDGPREREVYRVALQEYRWTLRISSTGAGFMKQAMAALDASPVCAAVQARPAAELRSAAMSTTDAPSLMPLPTQVEYPQPHIAPFDPDELDASLEGWFNAMDQDQQGRMLSIPADDGDVQWPIYS